MTSPFTVHDDQLKTLLDSYDSWIAANPDEAQYAIKMRDRDAALKNDLLNVDYLNNASDDDLYRRVYEYSRQLEGPAHMRLGEPRLRNQLQNIKRNLLYLISGDDEPVRKAARILEGDYKLEVFAKAFWSPLFEAQYPDELPNWNNKTESFMRQVGIRLGSSKLTMEERYRLLSKAFKYLRELAPNHDFYTLNHLMHYGTAINEGRDLLAELTGPTAPVGNQEHRIEHIINRYIAAVESFGGARYAEIHEGYKFKAVDTFQANFDLDAPDLTAMLDRAIANAVVAGSNWYPKKMIMIFSQEYPDETREALRRLFDENADMSERMDNSRKDFEELMARRNGGNGRNDTSYVDIRFITLLLALRYPEKYYPFKAEEYQTFISEVSGRRVSLPNKISAKYKIASQFAGALREALMERDDITPIHDALTASSQFKDPEYHWIVQDVIYTTSTRYLEKELDDNPTAEEQTMTMPHNFPLNQILYGPPGTGKTYATIRRALEIVHNNPAYCEGKSEQELNDEFKRVRQDGQIEFITFHQSYGYEEFIEGIRPVIEDGNVRYRVQDGVLKHMADLASSEYTQAENHTSINLNNVQFFKMSLGDTYDPNDSEIYEYCLANNCIGMDYGRDVDFSEVLQLPNDHEKWMAIKRLHAEHLPDETPFSAQAVNAFTSWMREGDLVFISKGNQKIRAIGRVTGPYEYRPSEEIRYSQFRKVEWLLTDVDIPAEKISYRRLSQATIYNMNPANLNLENIRDLLEPDAHRTAKNYVLIVDEINRGNISKTFGELITLIEDDKRAGAANELSVTLPYSGETFTMPENLYIIGTMNTADRSIALLDVALRRRFSFVDLYPEYNLPDLHYSELLRRLNAEIIERQGVEYQIGHAYLLGISTQEALAHVMDQKIIPLLGEYFYDDGETVRDILATVGVDVIQSVGRIKFEGLHES